MKRLPVERFARQLPQAKTDSVRGASAQKTAARLTALASSFDNSEDARSRAAQIKDFVLDNLSALQAELAQSCQRNGIQVHFAKDSEEANKIILDLCRQAAPDGGIVVKAKSMATEEIHLNHHLEKAGYEPVETDLGEYVVQIDHDTPSHIVTPIIHKNRKEIAASFERENLGPYTEIPEELAMQARVKLRQKFRDAKIGISGVNFAIAETGRIVLLENEGNNRLSTTAPDIHIALMGIEKMLPKESDLPTFLKLLAGSATGQQLTTYTHLITGPRRADEKDGPRQVHLVLLDNGRSRVLDGPYREILRCIRCGACLNVCPVYRQASGHAYGHVYSGPLGAVLAPALEGVNKLGHLAKASTLCGACEEVCPVKIPIPRMLVQLRDEATRAGAIKDPVQWGIYATGATKPGPWRTGLTLLPVASKLAPHPMKSGWGEFHNLPHRQGHSFRGWWKNRATASANPTPLEEGRKAISETMNESDEVLGGGQGWGQPSEESARTHLTIWQTFTTKLEVLGGQVASPRQQPNKVNADEKASPCDEVVEVAQGEGQTTESPANKGEADQKASPCDEVVGGGQGGGQTAESLYNLIQTLGQDKVCYLDADLPTIPGLITTSDVWQADIGITLADFAIAETGSIVLSAGSQRARLASLTPPTHIALVKEIVPTLEEAFARMTDRTSVIITGTSRTADIEGVLVRGVHGPKELIVIKLDTNQGLRSQPL